MIVTTSAQIKAIDAMTIDTYKIPGILLMEHAASHVMQAIEDKGLTLPIVVVCGRGNNVGDGLAIARLAKLRGYEVRVVLVGDIEALTPDALIMYEALVGLKLPIENIVTLEDSLTVLKPKSIQVVDALIGIGCTRTLQAIYKEVVDWVNDVSAYTFAVDIPSGIHCDSGAMMGSMIKADETVTFTLPKVGHFIGEGKHVTGQLKVVDIGIPESVLRAFEYPYELIDQSVMKILPQRHPDSHKMTFGRLLIVAGSETMSGACLLAAKAAYRAGSGLIEVLTHKNGHLAMQELLPEAIVHSYQDEEEGLSLMVKIKERLKQFQCILIGPGLSKSDLAKHFLTTILSCGEGPLVIDADGLNLLPQVIDLVDAYEYPIILTPHLGEMNRLTGHSVKEISASPFAFSNAYSQAHGVITVLKSSTTVVADGYGHYCINALGNDGMATAGSGDVLAGIVASVVGQGAQAFKGAVLGVGLHSMAGDRAAANLSRRGLMASDMIEALQVLLKEEEEAN